MIQGIFASNQGIVGDRVGDFASAILRIDPTGTALVLALSSGMGKSGAGDTIFHWFEDAHQTGRVAIVSGGTTTTIACADGTAYVPQDILMVESTGEIVLVTAVNGNDLTVTRGMGGTAIVSVTNVMFLQNIGNAHPEGAAMPTAVTQNGAPRMNYTQIFRNSWAVTGTAKAINFRTGNRVAKNKRDCALYHAEAMEKSMIFGRKHVTQIGGKPFRMTDGIYAQIEASGGLVKTVTDGTTPGNYSSILFDEDIRKIFSKNVKGQPNERIAIGGDKWISGINQMAKLDGTYNISQGETKWGIKITEVVTPFGTLKLASHPLFNENPTWQKNLMVLHPGGIKRRMLRETFEEGYDTNGNRIDGVDADQGVMTTEFGVEVGGASTMGLLNGFNKAVKSDSAQL